MTLPVSEVINSFGEAQSRIGRRAESRSQEAWVLSLADDPTLSTLLLSSLVPAFLPSHALSFLYPLNIYGVSIMCQAFSMQL